MKTSTTFGIHFWLKKTAKKKNSQVPIYARITVDGRRADISIRRTVLLEQWNSDSGRLNSRISNAKGINEYLDDIYAKLVDCHKQLHLENNIITTQAIKLRYLEFDSIISSYRKRDQNLSCNHLFNNYLKINPSTTHRITRLLFDPKILAISFANPILNSEDYIIAKLLLYLRGLVFISDLN